MQLTKAKLRQQCLAKRKQLSREQAKHAAQQLCNKIASTKIFIQASSIAAYWPHKSELDTIPLLQYAQSIGKQCYLPVIHPTKEKFLLFAEYTLPTALIKNKYGLLEPNIDNAKTIHPSELAIIFLPLIAFDKHGNRLGTGGGYYDATLQELDSKQQPMLIGVGYDFQEMPAIPTDPWDIALDLIITVNEPFN